MTEYPNIYSDRILAGLSWFEMPTHPRDLIRKMNVKRWTKHYEDAMHWLVIQGYVKQTGYTWKGKDIYRYEKVRAQS